jgi:hypothetical protein
MILGRSPKIVIGLCCSCDRLFDYDCFSSFKPLMAFSLIFSPHILFVCWFLHLLGSTIRRLRYRKDTWCYTSHHQQQLKALTIDKKLQMMSWMSPHLFGVEDMKYLLECLIVIESLTLSSIDQHFILDYPISLVHIVWYPFILHFQPIILQAQILASLILRTRFLLRR